jgi:selenocysteine lyase/cysteine desulfurase
VLAADVEFSSLLWPWVLSGHEVRTTSLSGLVDAIDESTDVVAVSAVQSVTGEVADLDGIVAAARANGSLVIVDATHACGWLPLEADRFDALVCSAYKWLLSPRGTAFLVVNDALAERMEPLLANWYAAGGALGTYYGLPVPLAGTAARFDLSPIWFSWIGTVPALEILLDIGVEIIRTHDVSLANRFRAGLGLAASNSAIVTARLPAAEGKLAQAGVRALVRAGTLRAAFHVYNREEDVDVALEALVG